MTTTPPAFPRARQGLDPVAVRRFAEEVNARLAEATQRAEDLAAENAALREKLSRTGSPTPSGEAEMIRRAAAVQGAEIVRRAEQQAAVVTERARQELAWSRRQVRHEQDRLNRRRAAMLSRLTSVTALASGTLSAGSDDRKEPAPSVCEPAPAPG